MNLRAPGTEESPRFAVCVRACLRVCVRACVPACVWSLVQYHLVLGRHYSCTAMPDAYG